ncbi:MAG: oligoribonuclease [Microbacteriaceae bacterium]|jgi:oligoribonuclease|nr:oligoribonuclease [Microbacteriaceae bacterium]
MAANDYLNDKRFIVWLDLEMTGLTINTTEPGKRDDEIVEIGVIVTDGNLVPLDRGMQLVIKPTDAAMANMGSFVRSMHDKSGLLPLLKDGVPVSDAEKQVLAYIQKHVPVRQTAQMGGNTIHMDRRFLAKYMPSVEDWVHYRNVDTSTIKEILFRWFPYVVEAAPEKIGNHRALADAIESIRELAFYREILFTMESIAPDRLAAARTTATDAWADLLA